jgi:hypothetical protein
MAAGSVLVEALVGISMLVVITTSLLAFSRSWLEASDASEVRTVGLAMAAVHISGEIFAPGPLESVSNNSGHPALTMTVARWASGADFADVCGVSGPDRIGGPVVTVARAEPSHPVVLRLLATRLEVARPREASLGASFGSGSLQIDGAGVHGRNVVIRTGEHEVTGMIDGEGCLRLPPLGPGRHVLVARAGDAETTLVDENHRIGEALQIERSVLDRAVVGTWVLSEHASISVDIETSGARAPDVVRPGALRWMVRGDDGRDAHDLGSARSLHPGPLSLVVSSCINPEAFGSSTSIDVAAGEELHVLVPLAVVTLDGLAGRSDDAINAVRVTGCSDGSGLRPTMRWEGGLEDGMRIALPHGDWEASVQTIAGARITGPVPMRAGAPDEHVTFP